MNTTTHARPETTTTSSSRRPGLAPVISAVLLVVIVIAAAVSFAAHRTTYSDDATTTTAPVPSSTSTRPTAIGPDGFAVPEVDLFGRRVDIPAAPAGQIRTQSVPRRQPQDPQWLTGPPAGLGEPGGWQRVHGAVVPFSTSDGPTVVRDGVAGGYARTPQGAALAAAMSVYQIIARPGDQQMLAQRVVMTDSERARFQRGIDSGRLPVQQPTAVTRTLIAHDAFRITSYADDLAIVELAVRTHGLSGQAASWVGAQVPMVWVDGDWRLRGSGQELTTQPVTTLQGWTRWA